MGSLVTRGQCLQKPDGLELRPPVVDDLWWTGGLRGGTTIRGAEW